jgi:hypothetical protein
MRIEYIEWVDANASCGWYSGLQLPDIAPVKTIGFVVREDKDQIVFALNVAGEDYNGSIAIPKLWIKKRKKIKI